MKDCSMKHLIGLTLITLMISCSFTDFAELRIVNTGETAKIRDHWTAEHQVGDSVILYKEKGDKFRLQRITGYGLKDVDTRNCIYRVAVIEKITKSKYN